MMLKMFKAITGLLILQLLALPSCPALTKPVYRIETHTQKYLQEQNNYQAYCNNGAQLCAPAHGPIYACPPGYTILDFAFCDYHQSQLVGVLFTNHTTTFLEIYDLQHKQQLLVKDLTFYHPWKIQFADVDGDATPEVCLGVYKKTPLHPFEANRIFIFNFQQGLQPKWRGSRLSYPFIDFVFVVIRQQPFLISLELTPANQYRLNSYQWDCFGFRHADTGITANITRATSLNLGYRVKSGQSQPVLFLVNGKKVIKIFNLGGE